MTIFAERTFDALAALSLKNAGPSAKAGFLHALVGREPCEAASEAPLKDLLDLSKELTNRPYLAYLHPSHLLPHLSLCPSDTLGYLISILPKSLEKRISDHTGQKAVALPNNQTARDFIAKTWVTFFDAIETHLKVFSPTSALDKILLLDEEQLRISCLGMALYALEPSLKHFIDRLAREQMKEALDQIKGLAAADFIRFLRKREHDISPHLPYHFPIQLWDKSPASLQELCEKFGYACLARLISDESEEFRNELNLHISQTTALLIPKATAKVNAEIKKFLLLSFELTHQFIQPTVNS